MNFVGSGARLTANDFGNTARVLGVPTAALLAFTEVEARGRGFDEKKRPVILFEPHVFDRCLRHDKAKRDKARSTIVGGRHLSYPTWKRDYPAGSDAQYRRLEAAMQIDETAALKACSWGMGQILGENFAETGSETVQEFVELNVRDERTQLALMGNLLVKRKLISAMNRLPAISAARTLAASWNGKSYEKNAYHTKLVDAFNKHSRAIEGVAMTAPTGVLAYGMRNEAVRALQADLLAVGIDPKGVDGRFGKGTFDAVKAFQASAGITVDGKAGPQTLDVLRTALAGTDIEPDGQDAEFDRDPPTGVATAAEPVESLQDAVDKLATPPAVDLLSLDVVVRHVQERLRTLGYPEVGNTDGKLGERMRGAILTFEADHGLPLTGAMSNELIAALRTATPRVVSAARAAATESDLASATGVKLGNAVKAGGMFAALLSTLGGLFSAEATIDDYENAATTAAALFDVVKNMSPWLVLALFGFGALYAGRRQIADQVAKYRAGNHV